MRAPTALFGVCSMLLSMSDTVRAQGSRSPTTDVSVAVVQGLTQLREDSLFPVVHRGYTAGAHVTLARERRHRTEIGFRPTYSRLGHRFETEQESFAAGSELHVSQLLSIHAWRSARLRLGPAAGLDHLLAYYPYWEETHVYWATSANLGASIQLAFTTRRHRHRTQLTTPLLALVSRPPDARLTVADDISFGGFVRAMHSRFQLGSIDRHRGLQLSHTWSVPVGRMHAGLQLRLDADRFAARDGAPLQAVHSRLSAHVVL